MLSYSMKRQNMKDEEAVHKLLVEINEDKMHQVEKNNRKVAKQEKGEVEKGSQTQWMRVIRQAWDGYEKTRDSNHNRHAGGKPAKTEKTTGALHLEELYTWMNQMSSKAFK